MRRLATRYICIHHSATPQDWGQTKFLDIIGRSHRDRGLLAGQGFVAYHLCIGHNWTAITRPEDSVGYHANNYAVNLTSYAVCVVGNFQADNLNSYQKNRLEGEIRRLKAQYPHAKVIGHRDASNTACPGRNIPPEYIGYLNQIQQEITKETYERLFREVWKQGGNTRDIAYFMKRVKQGSIPKNEKNIRTVMDYWHGIAHPWSLRHLRRMPSEEGLKLWKAEKRKVLG